MKKNILITGGFGFIGRNIQGGKRYSGRIEDAKKLRKEAAGMKGIVHLASVSNWRDCERAPESCIRANLLGLLNVLEVAKKTGAWVIFSSSFQYQDPTLYGMSKFMGEELCRIYAKKGVRIKIIRFPVVYGPGERSDKIVSRMIAKILLDGKPEINTERSFQFVFVEDMAKVIEREVNVMDGEFGPRVRLRSLAAGIKEYFR